MSRVAGVGAGCALAALVACAPIPDDADGAAVVQFSYETVTPETVRIAQNGNLRWVNTASDSQGFVVFPASVASGFTCGGNLQPYFERTAAGYQSVPITSFESDRVELPCPLKAGVYTYEIWIMGEGLGEVGSTPNHKLSGKIVVE